MSSSSFHLSPLSNISSTKYDIRGNCRILNLAESNSLHLEFQNSPGPGEVWKRTVWREVERVEDRLEDVTLGKDTTANVSRDRAHVHEGMGNMNSRRVLTPVFIQKLKNPPTWDCYVSPGVMINKYLSGDCPTFPSLHDPLWAPKSRYIGPLQTSTQIHGTCDCCLFIDELVGIW